MNILESFINPHGCSKSYDFSYPETKGEFPKNIVTRKFQNERSLHSKCKTYDI